MIIGGFRSLQLDEGVVRLIQPLAQAIDHVHCYLLRSSGGGWLLVDTGLGLPDPEARWEPVFAQLDRPVERIVVTHFHPDLVGGSGDVADLTGSARRHHAQYRPLPGLEPGSLADYLRTRTNS